MLSVSRIYSVNNGMINECGATGGMRIGRENHSTERKPTPRPLCSQVTYDLT
jgi:hypothetical protein